MIYSKDIPLPIKMDFDVKVSSFHLILNMAFISRAIVQCAIMMECGILLFDRNLVKP